MPGCVTFVLKRGTADFLIIKMHVDAEYSEKQSNGEAPGFYEVSRINGSWEPELSTENRIRKERYTVGIADRSKNVKATASNLVEDLKGAENVSVQSEFGMLLRRVSRRLVGSEIWGLQSIQLVISQ